MSRVMLVALVSGLALFAGQVMAEEAVAEKGAECSKAGCPISEAMAKLPQLQYTVGEETTHCAKSAGKLAEQHGLPITYAVGEETFDTKQAAYVALAAATEAYVDEFTTPHTCSKSGKTFVAGQSLHCSKTAAKFASLASHAAEGVHMTYAVGGEECHCPHAAEALAKSSGAEKLFVIGEEKTSCATSARLALARAKFRAAVEAIAAAEQEAESTES